MELCLKQIMFVALGCRIVACCACVWPAVEPVMGGSDIGKHITLQLTHSTVAVVAIVAPPCFVLRP